LNRFIYTIILFILTATVLKGQNDEKRLVQLSGFISDKSHTPVPGVAVISRKLHKSTVSERTGIYSITTTPGDTVFFRALGFKRYHTIIPENYSEPHCKVDIALDIDTISIPEVTVFPWKTYNEFLKDITRQQPVDPRVENMNDNLASIYVAISNQTNIQMSSATGFKYAMDQNFNMMATRNQYPVNNLLNPFAWAKFLSGIKNGMFKNQKFNKPTEAKVRKKIKTKDKK
jgi:hypothetical protein